MSGSMRSSDALCLLTPLNSHLCRGRRSSEHQNHCQINTILLLPPRLFVVVFLSCLEQFECTLPQRRRTEATSGQKVLISKQRESPSCTKAVPTQRGLPPGREPPRLPRPPTRAKPDTCDVFALQSAGTHSSLRLTCESLWQCRWLECSSRGPWLQI